MPDESELFWPSLYSRLVPHRYGADEDDAMAEDAKPEHFLTDFQTLRHHIETDLVSLLNATCLEASLIVEETLKDPDDKAERGPLVIEHGTFVVPNERRLPLIDHPHVRRSVVNYGLPSMIGQYIYRLRVEELEEEIREAILAFEPRLTKLTVRVERKKSGEGKDADELDYVDPEKPIGFDIRAEILGKAAPVGVRINTVWDLEKVNSGARLMR